MKYCPQCQTTYTDDLLKYCLKDGTPLGEVFDSQIQGAGFGASENTAPIRQVEPIQNPPRQTEPQQQQQQQYTPVQSTPVNYEQPVQAPLNQMQTGAPGRKTGSIVAMTILGTLLLLALGGLAAMYYLRNQKTAVAVNTNKPAANRPANANIANVQTTNLNTNQNINANVTATASPTATPKPSVNTQSAGEVADEVEATIDDWKNATENLDLGGQMSQYAETVDYYRSGRVDRRAVRADKDRAFGIYNDVNINISNLKITAGESGMNATALFDKEWNFEGDGNSSSGKVQQQLTLSKIGGRWLITGERDLRVYYTN